jgi:hypothetical protein
MRGEVGGRKEVNKLIDLTEAKLKVYHSDPIDLAQKMTEMSCPLLSRCLIVTLRGR